MSFVDELKGAPAERKREEERQRQRELEQQRKDWQSVIDEWYKRIKADCKRAATNERNSYATSFESFISEMDELEESSEGAPSWLSRVRFRIYDALNPIYPDRVSVCLSKDDIENIEAVIKNRLEADGLTVEMRRKEYQKYKSEQVFVKHSEGERAAAGILNSIFPMNSLGLREERGHYANKKVKDGFRYGLSVTASW